MFGMRCFLKKNFRPWLRDYLASFVLVLAASASLWIGARVERLDAGVVIGLPLVLLAMWRLRRARMRAYGKALEGCASYRANELLIGLGYQVRTNVAAPGGGDIDMVVEGRDGAVARIEIKAWHQLDYARKRRLAEQTRRIGRGKHLVLVWLPNAKAPEGLFALFCDPSRLCDKTYLVKGSAQRLRRALRRCGVYPN